MKTAETCIKDKRPSLWVLWPVISPDIKMKNKKKRKRLKTTFTLQISWIQDFTSKSFSPKHIITFPVYTNCLLQGKTKDQYFKKAKFSDIKNLLANTVLFWLQALLLTTFQIILSVNLKPNQLSQMIKL